MACINLRQQQAPHKEPANRFTKLGHGQQSTWFAQHSPVIITCNTFKECSWSKGHIVLLAQGWIRHLQRFLPTWIILIAQQCNCKNTKEFCTTGRVVIHSLMSLSDVLSIMSKVYHASPAWIQFLKESCQHYKNQLTTHPKWNFWLEECAGRLLRYLGLLNEKFLMKSIYHGNWNCLRNLHETKNKNGMLRSLIRVCEPPLLHTYNFYIALS